MQDFQVNDEGWKGLVLELRGRESICNFVFKGNILVFLKDKNTQ